MSSPLAVVVAGGKIYWTDQGTNTLRQTNTDGAGEEQLVGSLNAPGGIELDGVPPPGP